eukprot:gene20662-biopygen20953
MRSREQVHTFSTVMRWFGSKTRILSRRSRAASPPGSCAKLSNFWLQLVLGLTPFLHVGPMYRSLTYFWAASEPGGMSSSGGEPTTSMILSSWLILSTPRNSGFDPNISARMHPTPQMSTASV